MAPAQPELRWSRWTPKLGAFCWATPLALPPRGPVPSSSKLCPGTSFVWPWCPLCPLGALVADWGGCWGRSPICSRYGRFIIFIYIWVIYGVSLDKYYLHGASGSGTVDSTDTKSLWKTICSPRTRMRSRDEHFLWNTLYHWTVLDMLALSPYQCTVHTVECGRSYQTTCT